MFAQKDTLIKSIDSLINKILRLEENDVQVPKQ